MLAPAAAQPAPDRRPLVPEGETLAVTLEATAELLSKVQPRQSIYALAWHPNGKELATGDASGAVTFWNLETGLEKRHLGDASRAVKSLSYSSDGRWFAGSSDAGIVRLWDLAAIGKPLLRDGWTVAFNPSGSRLAIGSKDGVVTIFDLQNHGAEPLSWQGHNERIAALAWHPEGIALATGSWDRTVKLWNSSDGSFLRRLNEDHGERVNAVSWSPGGDLLASAAADSTVRIWSPETGEELRRFDGHSIGATAVAWHPEGDMVVSSSRDATVRLWSYVSGSEVARFEDYGGAVFGVGFNPSGSLLASGTEEGFVGIWSFSSGKLVRRLGGEVGSVEVLAFGDRGQALVTGSKGVIRLWMGDDTAPSAPLMLELAGGRAPRCLALGSEGEVLAAGFQDGRIAWWRRAEDGARRLERQTPLPAHTSAVAALAFSPDAERLAAGFDDGTIQVWNLATGAVHGTFEYPQTTEDPRRPKSRTLAFSPDGERLLGGFENGSVYLWSLEPSDLPPRKGRRLGGEPLAARFTSSVRVSIVLRGGNVLVWDTDRNTLQTAVRLERRLKAAALGSAAETVAIVGDRSALVRVASLRSPRAVSLSRLLLGSAHEHWVDCRSPGRCYRYDDGTLLLRQDNLGELEPLPLQRSAAVPELELAEPLPESVQLVDGETGTITVKLRNPGPQRAIWVNVRQASLELRDPIVFYTPPVEVVVEPGQTVNLHGRVSMHSAYESPASEEANLQLVVTSAGGKHLFLDPIRITNSVATVEWRSARMSFGGGRLSVDLANTGGGPFSADRVAIRALTPVGPITTDAFRGLSAGEEARCDLELPAEARANPSPRLDFVAYKTQLPVHRWTFENRRLLRFPFDRPWLYLALLLALLVVMAYVRPRFASWRRRAGAGRHSGIHKWIGDPNAEYVHLAIVFTDVVKSTELLHDIKTDAWATVRNQHFDRINALVKLHSGYVVRFIGDGSMLAFRSSIDALKFAVEIENQPGHGKINVRVGVHVGQVQVDRNDAHGPVVNLASRVMDTAENGGVLVSREVKADYDSAFDDEHHPYSWLEIRDPEIPDFPGQDSLWSVRYRPDGGSLAGEDD